MIFLAMVIASCLYKNTFDYKTYFEFHYVRVNIILLVLFVFNGFVSTFGLVLLCCFFLGEGEDMQRGIVEI